MKTYENQYPIPLTNFTGHTRGVKKQWTGAIKLIIRKTEISNFARFGIELFTHRSQVSTSAKLCT